MSNPLLPVAKLTTATPVPPVSTVAVPVSTVAAPVSTVAAPAAAPGAAPVAPPAAAPAAASIPAPALQKTAGKSHKRKECRVVNRKAGSYVGLSGITNTGSKTKNGWKPVVGKASSMILWEELNESGLLADASLEVFEGDFRLFNECQSFLASWCPVSTPSKKRKNDGIIDPPANATAAAADTVPTTLMFGPVGGFVPVGVTPMFAESVKKKAEEAKEVAKKTKEQETKKTASFPTMVTDMLMENPANIHSLPYIYGELIKLLDLGGPDGKGPQDAALKKFKTQVSNALKRGTDEGKYEKVKASFRMDQEWMKAWRQQQRSKASMESKGKNAKDQLQRMKEAELVGLGDVSHKKKRRFPMDDLMLIREDAFYKDRTGKSLPARPPMRADPLDNHELKGCTPDVVFVHQCFRGGLGFDRGLTPEFSVQVLSAALKELGSAYCTTGGRFPVLLTQLFVSALEKVVFKRVEGKDEDEESSEEESWEDTEEDTDEEQEVPRGKRDRHKAAPPSEIDERYLQLGYFEDIISPITWPEVLIHYLETQQNFHVREKDVQKELVEDLRNAKVNQKAAADNDDGMDYGSDSDNDEPRSATPGTAAEDEEQAGGYLGTHLSSLYKGYHKLKRQEPWMLTPKECLALLRVLTDDLLSKCLPEEFERRAFELDEIVRAKKRADLALAKVRNAFERANFEKEKEEKEVAAAAAAEAAAAAAPDSGSGDKKKAVPPPSAAAAAEAAAAAAPDSGSGDKKKAVPPSKKKKEVKVVTQEEVDEAEEEAEARNAEFLKGAKANLFRQTELGKDRDYNTYWLFDSCPSYIFVERAKDSDINEWWYYDSQTEFDVLLSSLDKRGVRELALYESLLANPLTRKQLVDDKKGEREAAKMAEEEARLRKKLQEAEEAASVKRLKDEAAGRRSTRVKAEPTLDSVGQLADQLELHLKYCCVKKEERVLSDEERRMKGTGALACLEFDNNYREKKVHEEPEYVAGELNTDCKATMIMNKGGVSCMVEEILHAEAELDNFSSFSGGEAMRELWRKRVADVGAGFEASVDVKNVGHYVKRLKEPVLELEQRMFDVIGMAFFSECEDICANTVMEEEEESDDESADRSQIVWGEEEEDEEEAFQFLSDGAMAVSCSLQVKDRKSWRQQVRTSDTIAKIASLLFGFLREFGDYLFAMNEGKEEAVVVLKGWGGAEKKGKGGKKIVRKEGMKMRCESEPVRGKLWWAKVDKYLPYWPCHEHAVGDDEISKLLKKHDLTVVSMVGGMVEGQEGKKGSEGGELLLVAAERVLEMWKVGENKLWEMIPAPDAVEEVVEEEEEEEEEEEGGGEKGKEKRSKSKGKGRGKVESGEQSKVVRKALDKATLKSRKLMIMYVRDAKKENKQL